MPIPGNLLTTDRAVMPHTNIDKALATALSLDIPFWPQLPNYSYYKDMHVQAAEHFPGIVLDMDLWDKPAIRSRLQGPVSFGFNILDQDERPILFDDNVHPFMFEFMARRLNTQLKKLKQKNSNSGTGFGFSNHEI